MLSRAAYLEHRRRQFGRANPQRMHVPHWVDMVRSGETADAADRRYLGESNLGEREPGWCFDRFGMTRTRLDDGRVVCVGGEHEDHYDPNFCIYNDVVDIQPGGDVAIYGYPPDVFPPTDFHTATQVGDELIVIGSLGYGGQRRYGHTPVHALDLRRLTMRAVETEGDAPGWVYKHHARLTPDGKRIRVGGGKIVGVASGKEKHPTNGGVFELDLRTMRWSVGEAPWVRWPEERVEWPPGWEPVKWNKARDVADAVARSAGPDHPLFAHAYVPVAESTDAVLLRAPGDPEELVVFEGPTWTGREAEPPRFEAFRGLEAWRRVAGVRGWLWWGRT